MTRLYITQPVVEMREEGAHESKVVSQTFFAEEIKIDKEEKGWSYITTPDQYKGWIPSDAYVSLKEPYPSTCTISRLAAHLYKKKDIEYGPFFTLPYGVKLHAVDDSDPRWIKIALPDRRELYVQKGDVLQEPVFQSKSDLASLSHHFLGLPYTWGGRSSFGFDCSGFVQMLYGKIGILLPRDSHQQVLDARFETCCVNELEPGDLLFFGKSEARIMHVGLSLGNEKFIHATSRENQPWIRISNLSDFEWSGDDKAYYPYRIGRRCCCIYDL